MTGKAPSALPSFREALVIRADYGSAPGMGGVCELAIRWRKTQTEVWVWNDEWGSACVVKLPKNAGHTQLVNAIAGNEQVSSTIDPRTVSIYRDKPPLGKLLALAWAAEFDSQAPAQLLSLLHWDELVQIERYGGGIDSDEMRKALADVEDSMNDYGLSLDELGPVETQFDATPAGVRAALRHPIAILSRRQHTVEAALNPFKKRIQQVIVRWAMDKPKRRFPGGGLPPLGRVQLERYLKDYVLAHRGLPTGRHSIPEGQDLFSIVGPEFEVDFDALAAVES